MSFQSLVQALQSVPFLGALDITVEEARPGASVLRLPASPQNLDHSGALHTAAMFTVGEASAGVAVGTCPRMVGVTYLQKATGIKYVRRCTGDVTAHADLPDEVIDGVLAELDANGRTQAEIISRLMDGHGNDVAEVVAVYTFRR